MKILISEQQLKRIISEQPDSRFPIYGMTDRERMDVLSGKYDHGNIGSAVIDLTINFYKKHPDIVTFGAFLIPYVGPYIGSALVADQTVDAWNSAETTEEKSIIALGVACNVMFGIKLGVNATSSTVLNNLKRKSFKIIADKLKSNNLNKLTPNEVNIVSEMGKHKEEISMALQQKVKPFAKSIKKVEPKGKPPRERSWMDFDKRPTEVKVFENQKYEYIQKYGQDRFNKLESSFKSGKITEERFKGWLNVRTKTIPLKQLPRKFYHGTQNKITFEELNPLYRKEAYKEFDPMRSRTGSSNPDNVGIYFTDNINGEFGYNYERNITFGKYKNTKGFESASKWAKHGNENGYIYEITLKPTATIVENGTLNSNVVNVTTNMYDKLKSFKVDAIWSGNELNVLNKDAIQTFKPIFKFDYKTSKWIKL